MRRSIVLRAALVLMAGLWLPVGVAWAQKADLLAQGEAQWRQGRLIQAEALFRQAVEADPEASGPHARLGAFYLMTDRAAQAVGELRKAIMLDPESPRLFVLMSLAYVHQGRHDMAQAMVRQAIELDPGLQQARSLERYLVLKEQGRRPTHP